MNLDDRISQACEAVGAGQKSDQFLVEPIDLLSEGRRAKMLRVWEVFQDHGGNIQQTAKAFRCARNTVKAYIRLYRETSFGS